ncbi:MAG: endonuclease/exonuclease/phosphatase family protein [Planctomycetota bacterium]
MQRLMSLAMLAVLLGGGYTALNTLLPSNVRQAVDQAGAVLQQRAGQQSGYSGYDRSATGYAPAPAAPASVIRIASYNIQVFGNKKAADANVMRTLAAVVQQFDIVAIQEIRTTDQDFIDKFLSGYVNASGRRYSRVVGPRLGRTSSKEQYAFLFDTATIQVNPNYIYTVRDEDDVLHREPHVAMFATRAPQNPFTFILMNCHTDPDETDTELNELARSIDAVRRHASSYLSPPEDDVILLGDLNTAVRISPTRQLRPDDLYGIGRIAGIYPVIRTEPTNTVRSKLHDNLLVNRMATTEFTGNSGVYDLERQFGLTRDQALQVSDHLPVWAEFSVVEGGTPGRLASGRPQQPGIAR